MSLNRHRLPIFRSRQRMFDREKLKDDLDMYKISPQELPERSIDDNLDTTDLLCEWARKKTKGTNIDPDNRRPVQVRHFVWKFNDFNG